MSTLSVRLPEELETRLEAAARADGLPRSELVRRAVDDFLARRAAEQQRARLGQAARRLVADVDSKREALSVAEDFTATDAALVDEGPWWTPSR